MRVLLVSEDPRIPGGIPGYAVPLAEELARRGHRIEYLYSGGYLRDYDLLVRRRWRRRTAGSVRYHGLVNAKSIGVHAGRPELDVTCDDSRVIAARARALRPDVVHVHSLLGVPAETLPLLAAEAPVVATVHEFGLLCQRRVLVRRDGTACTTYHDQRDCASCVDVVDPRRYRVRARLAGTLGGAPLRAAHLLERLARRDVRVVADGPVPAAGHGAEPFRRRLARSVELVNGSVSHVLAVSVSVRDVLLRAGVDPSLVSVLHIGSGSAERLAPLPLPSSQGAPVTFLFLGGLVPGKGAHVLVEALARLGRPPRLLVAGRGELAYEQALRAAAPPSVEFLGPYAKRDLPDILARADVVVAPAVGPDTSPQVVLEALAAGRPVIGSRIGGIPDFVHDGVNGLLVEPGDAGALASSLDRLRDPGEAARLARSAVLPTSLAGHVDALEELYAGLV